MSRTIEQDVLIGINKALKIHRPDLLPLFQQIFQSGQFEGAKLDAREFKSIYGKLTATVSWKDGEPILRALEAIDRELGERGDNVKFEGHNMDGLIYPWRRFVAEIPPPSP